MSDLAAAAATALRATLTAPEPRPGRVLAAFPSAVYVGLDDPAPDEPVVLAIVTADGVRLPNALVIAPRTVGRPFHGVRAGQPARVGRAAVQLPTLRVTAARWWDPRPVLGTQPEGAVGAVLRRTVVVLGVALAAAPSALADRLQPLALALADDDAETAAAAADGLLGLGPGLTPAGDDVLAGALATLTLLAPAGRRPGADGPTSWADCTQSGRAWSATGARAGLDRAVAELAGRTTALSAALLGCARRGQVAAPAADLLRALTGHGEVQAAAARLVRVGHSSGRDLAAGILLAARAVTARAVAGAVA